MFITVQAKGLLMYFTSLQTIIVADGALYKTFMNLIPIFLFLDLQRSLLVLTHKHDYKRYAEYFLGRQYLNMIYKISIYLFHFHLES